MIFSHNRISAFNLGEYCAKQLAQSITEATQNDSVEDIRYREALRVQLTSGEAWIFDYGIAVFWGVSNDDRSAFFEQHNIECPVSQSALQENLRFVLGNKLNVGRDLITLTDELPLTRLAVSHALAQSLKLSEYELNAQTTIQNNSELPEALATTGKIRLSRKAIAKIRGQLFSTKSDIILHYGLLDTPDFFWDYPQYEATYNLIARYLEIHQRVNLLSKKLETIHELFEMLADEQKHQHSAFLEWIVIILIAIEVVIFLAQEVQKLVQ